MGYSEKVLDENKTPTQVHINCSLSVPFEEIEKCKQWATKVGYDYQNITDLLFTAYYNGLFMPDYRELELCHYSYEED